MSIPDRAVEQQQQRRRRSPRLAKKQARFHIDETNGIHETAHPADKDDSESGGGSDTDEVRVRSDAHGLDREISAIILWFIFVMAVCFVLPIFVPTFQHAYRQFSPTIREHAVWVIDAAHATIMTQCNKYNASFVASRLCLVFSTTCGDAGNAGDAGGVSTYLYYGVVAALWTMLGLCVYTLRRCMLRTPKHFGWFYLFSVLFVAFVLPLAAVFTVHLDFWSHLNTLATGSTEIDTDKSPDWVVGPYGQSAPDTTADSAL